MATRHRIRCINKTDRYDPDDRIEYVGGTNPDGGRWKVRQAEAVRGIESGRWAFYVERPDRAEVDVVVSVSARGNKYLRTRADREQPNNLLSLPECP